MKCGVNSLSQVGNIMTLKFTVQPSYNQMGIWTFNLGLIYINDAPHDTVATTTPSLH